ncbi:MAG: hypothetical protein ABRQ38_15635, partial [Candidatus Eremiobacterota bacterium]
MEIIKDHTKSLCPECYKKIDATVAADGDRVIMIKTCQTHGTFRGLVEKDVDFYKKITSANKDDSNFNRCLMINITHAC